MAASALCVSDLTIARDRQLRLPETTLGLVPAQIAPYLVARLGYGEARRLATGGRLDAHDALRLAWFMRCDAGELMPEWRGGG